MASQVPRGEEAWSKRNVLDIRAVGLLRSPVLVPRRTKNTCLNTRDKEASQKLPARVQPPPAPGRSGDYTPRMVSPACQYDDGAARTFHSRSLRPGDGAYPADTWMESELPATLTDMFVLDAGCGTGRWFPHFEARGAKTVVGIDASRAMLARIPGQEILEPDALTNAQPLRDRGIVVVQGLLHEVLPRLALQVDLAFASFSLCVMDDPQQALDALHNTLRPGACALVSTSVLVLTEDAPAKDGSPREVAWDRRPAIETRGPGGRRRDLLVVAHVPGYADLPLTDKAHCLDDYAIDPQKWTVEKAHLLASRGVTLVDGKDKARQERYYGAVAENAVSLEGTTAQLASLCLKLRKS